MAWNEDGMANRFREETEDALADYDDRFERWKDALERAPDENFRVGLVEMAFSVPGPPSDPITSRMHAYLHQPSRHGQFGTYMEDLERRVLPANGRLPQDSEMMAYTRAVMNQVGRPEPGAPPHHSEAKAVEEAYQAFTEALPEAAMAPGAPAEVVDLAAYMRLFHNELLCEEARFRAEDPERFPQVPTFEDNRAAQAELAQRGDAQPIDDEEEEEALRPG